MGLRSLLRPSHRHRVHAAPILVGLLGGAVALAVLVLSTPDKGQMAAALAATIVLGVFSYWLGWRLGLPLAIPAAAPYWFLLATGDVSGNRFAYLAVLAVVALGAVAMALGEAKYLIAGLKQVQLFDPVTKLANYDYFVAISHHEVSRSERFRVPFSLILVEPKGMDEFARQRGYHQLDRLLREMAVVMDNGLRGSDTLARLGGPSFGILLPMTPREGALEALARLEQALQTWHPLQVAYGGALEWYAVVVQYPVDGQTLDELLDRANAILSRLRPAAQGNLDLQQLSIYARELQELYRQARQQRDQLPAPAGKPDERQGS